MRERGITEETWVVGRHFGFRFALRIGAVLLVNSVVIEDGDGAGGLFVVIFLIVIDTFP